MITSITIENFKCYTTPQTFEFSEPVTLITGPNGSGKSSITEACQIALTGKLDGHKARGADLMALANDPSQPMRFCITAEGFTIDRIFKPKIDMLTRVVTISQTVSIDGAEPVSANKAEGALSMAFKGRGLFSVPAFFDLSPNERLKAIVASLGKPDAYQALADERDAREAKNKLQAAIKARQATIEQLTSKLSGDAPRACHDIDTELNLAKDTHAEMVEQDTRRKAFLEVFGDEEPAAMIERYQLKVDYHSGCLKDSETLHQEAVEAFHAAGEKHGIAKDALALAESKAPTMNERARWMLDAAHSELIGLNVSEIGHIVDYIESILNHDQTEIDAANQALKAAGELTAEKGNQARDAQEKLEFHTRHKAEYNAKLTKIAQTLDNAPGEIDQAAFEALGAKIDALNVERDSAIEYDTAQRQVDEIKEAQKFARIHLQAADAKHCESKAAMVRLRTDIQIKLSDAEMLMPDETKIAFDVDTGNMTCNGTPRQCLSGGEKAAFDAAFGRCMTKGAVMIEASELDPDNLESTLYRLKLSGGQFMVCTWMKGSAHSIQATPSIHLG